MAGTKKAVVLTDTANFVLKQNDRSEVLEHLSAVKGETVDLPADIYDHRLAAGVIASVGSKAAKKAKAEAAGEEWEDDEPVDTNTGDAPAIPAASDAASGTSVTPDAPPVP